MAPISTKSLASLLIGASAAYAACTTGPAVNQATLTLIEGFESFSATVYDDPTGNPTIGWGHLCSDTTCSDVPYPQPLSKADGAKLLQSDLQIAENCIAADLPSVTLNANQYGALVSWSFNVGCGNAGGSSLVTRLNNGEDPGTVISQELPKWNKSGGTVLPGLTRRRAAEVNLAHTPSNSTALPC